MTNYNKRVFEMLVRVLVFRLSIQELLGKDSQINESFTKLEAALKRIEAQFALQASGQNKVRMSSAERTAAREALRGQLENLTWTASSMGLKQFFMPRDRGDRFIVSVARIFAQLAEPLKEEFVKYHLPEDFIERLKAAIAGVERAIEEQAAGKGSRKRATATIATAQEEALAEVARLDPLMENLLYGNEPLKASWYAARRIERPAASRRESAKEEPATPAEPPPVPSVIPPDRMSA
jgi:hypothetical protein